MRISNKEILLKAYQYLKGHLWKAAIIFLLILLRNAGALSFPYFLKLIIDDVFLNANFQALYQILGMIAGIQLISSLAGVAVNYMQQHLSNYIMEDVKADLFEHVIHLPVSFYNKNDVGEVIHILSNEMSLMQRYLTTSLVQLANNTVMIIGIFIILYFLNAYLFLVCISLVPILVLTVSFFHTRVRSFISAERQADSKVLSFMVEKLQSALLVKLYNQYSNEVAKLRTRIEKHIDLNLRLTLFSSMGTNLAYFVAAMAPLMVLGFGSSKVFEGIITLGTLVAFLEYFNLVLGPSRNMVGIYYNTLRVHESMSKTMGFLNIPIPDKPRMHQRITNPVQELVCENVKLTLGESEVLKDINISFYKGRSYGFVGGSGSGKSSLTYLLCKLYSPDSGTVYINDENAEDLGIYAVSEKIGLVKSTTKLQRGTIKDNILFGIEEPEEEMLTGALKSVGLYDFIQSLPDKMDTDVSDLGTKLSDGQRQRLAIARALLRDTEVLILDEATSAMDSINETKVINKILRLYRNKILIVISHRLSSIQGLDEIICLEDGVIMEQSSHDDLISKKGAYWRLFEKQLIRDLPLAGVKK